MGASSPDIPYGIGTVTNLGVVCAVDWSDGWEYGVDGVWWFSHEQLKFVSPPTSETIRQAIEHLESN